MLIFDQLQKADRPLRLLSWSIATGLAMLLGGLWWVQVVRSRHYGEEQRNQSYRTVRVPAPRGKILDRHGVALAENRPSYNMNLFLGDRAWRDRVRQHFRASVTAARQAKAASSQPNGLEKFLSWFGYRPSLVELGSLDKAERLRLELGARYAVTSNIVHQLGVVMGQPLVIDEKKFHQHYDQRRALPLPVAVDLNPRQVARLQERALSLPGLEMDIQPTRLYPHGSLAAHLLGYLQRDNESVDGEVSDYSYRLPDFRGASSLERSLDEELRGKAGGKSVLVNNLGYRQSESVWAAVEAGQNVTLTIDVELQRATEQALASAPVAGPVRGAAVVLDVRTGEVLALASAPTFDPNKFIPFITPDNWNEYNNTNTTPMLNRAIFGGYMPGSTFKTVVALAALEAGTLDPAAIYASPGIYPFGRGIRDTAGAGDFDFKRAFKKSSNCYFIDAGLKVGPDAILAMAARLHFGERTGLPLAQDSRGLLPTREWWRQNRGPWQGGDTANLSMGQGELKITPLQMAVAMAAVANGGKVLFPQLIASVQPQDQMVDPANQTAIRPRLHDQLPVSPRTLGVIHEAMLADTEDSDGTGTAARLPGFRVCGKTGTAQVFKGTKVDHLTVWFASFAPFEDPRYAVVVMVDYGGGGGTTCAPVAAKIYHALRYREQHLPAKHKGAFAKN